MEIKEEKQGSVDMTLSIVATLKNKFPTVDVPPFGKCLAVPLKALSKSDESELKSKGFKVIYQSLHGQLSAVIPLSKETLEQSLVEPKTDKPSEIPLSPTMKQGKVERQLGLRWTTDDEKKLESIYAENSLPVFAIAEMFGRTPQSIRHKLEAMKVKRILEDAPTKPTTPTPKSSSPIDDLLDSAKALLPDHKRGAVTILKEALFILTEGSEGQS